MCDMGALENLVANTAYLKAQGGDDKDVKRRRRSLSLPKLEVCDTIHSTTSWDFEEICENQPIGKKLFWEFLLNSEAEFAVAAEFLDKLKDWDLAEAGAKDQARQNVISKFCQVEANAFLSYLEGDVVDKCKAVSGDNFEEVMGRVKDATVEFLKGRPFSQYHTSPSYDKFVQWKQFERQPITEKYFYEFRTLGRGGFGEVCAVQVKTTGQMYACKKLDKKRLKKKGGGQMVLLEKRILEKVNSRFLVNLAYAFQTKSHLCLAMSLMNGGDLKHHIYRVGQRGLRRERAAYYAAQMTAGLLHLHAIKVVYRDMKPENVLLDGQGQCRLSDLGLAVELGPFKSICQRAGTVGYMAPEVLRDEPYTWSVDWWSLGCSIYEMIAGRLPFKEHKEKVQVEEVTRRTLQDECKFEHEGFDTSTADIIGLFLKKNIGERLGCNGDDPRKHEFFKAINFARLEAGLTEAPWLPKPNVVYAKDTGDIRDFSEVKGVSFDASDERFFAEFSTGAVPIPWQQEMIDSGLFDELNNPKRMDSPQGLKKKPSKSCTLF